MDHEAPKNGELGDAERVALLYASSDSRAALQGLLLLDAQLGRIASASREPVLAQLKLAWWRDACADLATSRRQPIIEALAREWLEHGEQLVRLVDAWEEMAVGETGSLSAAELVAKARAGAFAAAAGMAVDDSCRSAARRWTLVTLADGVSKNEERAAMLAVAGEIGAIRLPRALRPLAVLDGLARRSLARGGGPLLGDRMSPLAAIRLGIFGR